MVRQGFSSPVRLICQQRFWKGKRPRASSPRDFAVILNCNHARDDTQALKILPTDYQMVLDRGTKRSMIRQNRGSARSLLTNMSTHTGEPSHTRQRTIPSPPFLCSSALYTICTIEACGVGNSCGMFSKVRWFALSKPQNCLIFFTKVWALFVLCVVLVLWFGVKSDTEEIRTPAGRAQ